MVFLKRTAPGHDLGRFQDEVNRLFDGLGGLGTTWIPAVDVSEDGNGFTFRMDAPGLESKDVRIEMNGDTLSEPYSIRTDPSTRPPGFEPRDNFGPYTLAPGELFMMGDNRDNSNDSRYWGALDMDLVKGRAMFLYWSWDSEHNWPRWNRLFHLIR